MIIWAKAIFYLVKIEKTLQKNMSGLNFELNDKPLNRASIPQFRGFLLIEF